MDGKLFLSDRQMALLLASMAAVMPFSIDAYLPAVKEIAAGLGAGEAAVQTNLVFFLIGQSAGVLVGGAWSDWAGRKTVAVVGLAVYCAASLALTLLGSLDAFLFWRLVQAFGAGMAAVTGGALVRDYYAGRQAAQMFALIGVIMMAAPLLAPLIGWAVMYAGGWRAVFGFLLCYAAAVCLLQWRFLPHSVPVPPQGSVVSVVAGRYLRVFRTREALGFLLFQAFSFSSMFVFLTESPSVYMVFYGLEEGAYAAVFALNIVTMMAFNRLTAWRLRCGADPARLLLAGWGVQFAANAVMFLMTRFSAMPPFAAVVAAVMVSVGTQGLIGANTQACFMAYFREEGGSANGVLLTCMVLVAAAAGFLATRLHDGTAAVMPAVMLLCTVCAAVCLFGFSFRRLRQGMSYV